MPSVPAAPPARRPLSRKLTIIAEGPYGHHQRLELLVPPGMTVAELPLDDSHPTLVQPGGGLLGRTDYLFEIAADTPRLFALYHPSPPAPQPIPSPQRPSSPSRLLSRAGRALAALSALPRRRHGVGPSVSP